MMLRRLFYDEEGERTPLLWGLILLVLFTVVFTVCNAMDRKAAKNPLYRMPGWVQTCAQQRPLADCERDWQTLEARAQRKP